MQLDDLFRHYADPYELAVALLKVYGTRPDLLAQAAERWVSKVSDVSTRPYRSSPISMGGVEEAVWRLLGALPITGGVEFDPFRALLRTAREEFTPPDFPGSKGVLWKPVLLDAVTSLAPARQEFSHWREILLGVVRHRSDEYVFHLATHLSDEMPDLAYELLDEALRRPEPAPQTHYFRRPTGLFKSMGAVRIFDPCGWIALSRLGSVPAAALGERDHNEFRAITASQYLDDYFELTVGIVRAGRQVPEAVLDAARGALVSEDPRVRIRGVALLARFERTREEAVDVLSGWGEWVRTLHGQPRSAFFDTFTAPHGYGLADNVKIHAHGLFHGHGWGREKQRELLPRLVEPLLHGKGWSIDPWRAMLGPPLLSRAPLQSPQIDAHVRDVVAEYLFRLAKDTTESVDRRREAIRAIARAQACTYARDLSFFRSEPALRDVVQEAQRHLREVNRVSDLAVDVALDVSMRAFVEATT